MASLNMHDDSKVKVCFILCLLALFCIIVVSLTIAIVLAAVYDPQNESKSSKSSSDDDDYSSIPELQLITCKNFDNNNIETSGITFNKIRNTFFVAQNRTYLVEYDTNFKELNSYYLPEQEDTEGVTFINGNYYGVVDEKIAAIRIYELVNGEMVNYNEIYTGLQISYYYGLEGITFNDDKNIFYVIREKYDPSVYSMDLNGNLKKMFDVDNVLATDISGIVYDGYRNRMFICSDESKRILEYNLKGQLTHIYNLDKLDMDNIEGITVTKNYMVLVGEPNRYALYLLL